MTNKNKIGWGILTTLVSLWAWNTYLDVSVAIQQHNAGGHLTKYGGNVCKTFTDSIHWISTDAQVLALMFSFIFIVGLIALSIHLIFDGSESIP